MLVDLEQFDRAEEVVKSLDEPIYATLIRGRIQLANGEPAAALESFENGIRHWPNNPGARYLAGVAAYELGDWERAVSELREAMRADSKQTQAAQLLARIYYDRGDYQQAVDFSAAAVRRSGDDPTTRGLRPRDARPDPARRIREGAQIGQQSWVTCPATRPTRWSSSPTWPGRRRAPSRPSTPS